jgi:hypothetical protein
VSRVLGNGVPAEGGISASEYAHERALLAAIDAMELQLSVDDIRG